MKKLIVTLFALIVFFSNLAQAQNLFSSRSPTITTFVSTVLKDKKETRVITDNYLYVGDNTNNGGK